MALALPACLAALYPLLVYAGIRNGVPVRVLALGLLALLALRWGRRAARALPVPALLACGAAALAAAWIWSEASMLYYPVAVNLVLLAVFGASLWAPQTVVERLARLRHPDLDERGVRYTRKVTMVWCLFFSANAAVSLATALSGDAAWWAFHNGFLAYVLMGLIFGGEYLVRRKVMAAGGA